MCYRTTCPQCGKATWGGCGAHIEQALRGVPESQRCHGHKKGEKKVAQNQRGSVLLLVNEAGWDRALRVVLGVALLALVFVGPHTAWGLIGLVPLLTGLFGFCPLYRVFGVSTCAIRRSQPSP